MVPFTADGNNQKEPPMPPPLVAHLIDRLTGAAWALDAGADPAQVLDHLIARLIKLAAQWEQEAR